MHRSQVSIAHSTRLYWLGCTRRSALNLTSLTHVSAERAKPNVLRCVGWCWLGRQTAHTTPLASEFSPNPQRPPKCGERTSCAPLPLPPHTTPLFVSASGTHTSLLFVPQAELARAARAWQRPTLCLPACGESGSGAAARAWLGHTQREGPSRSVVHRPY